MDVGLILALASSGECTLAEAVAHAVKLRTAFSGRPSSRHLRCKVVGHEERIEPGNRCVLALSFHCEEQGRNFMVRISDGGERLLYSAAVPLLRALGCAEDGGTMEIDPSALRFKEVWMEFRTLFSHPGDKGVEDRIVPLLGTVVAA